jgi:flagella basal body P-ring formation protein FlgA
MRAIYLLAAVMLMAAAPAWGATKVTLRAQATVSGAQVTLGEIADIAADKPEAAAKLAAIIIAPSPLPGGTYAISRTQVLAHVRQAGIAPDAVTLAGAPSVAVTRAATTISGDDLAAAGRDALAALAPPDVTPEIICARRPADLSVPQGAIELKAEIGPGSLGGTRTVGIAVLVDGQVLKRALVTYTVRLSADVLVAKRFVARHASLDPTAFAVERRDVALIAGRALRSVAEIAGLRAASAIPVNAVVTDAMVEEVPVINRGDLVAVTVRSGGITISTQAIALGDARTGETLRLRDPVSKQEFEATAAGPKQAEIVFPASAKGGKS